MNDAIFLALVIFCAVGFLVYRRVRRSSIDEVFSGLEAERADRLPESSSFDLSLLITIHESKCFRIPGSQGLCAGVAGFVTGVPGYEKEMVFVFSPLIRNAQSVCCLTSEVSRYFDVGYGKPVTREIPEMSGWRSSSGRADGVRKFVREVLGQLHGSQCSGEIGPNGMLIICPMNASKVQSVVRLVQKMGANANPAERHESNA
ncbi:MAG: hypothetical protein P1U64_09725 [Alcanivoracaceae bacterium]|nr:hypothetical protein [Alcanivoracaceae bacterium]